jgi:hypothetical protein
LLPPKIRYPDLRTHTRDRIAETFDPEARAFHEETRFMWDWLAELDMALETDLLYAYPDGREPDPKEPGGIYFAQAEVEAVRRFLERLYALHNKIWERERDQAPLSVYLRDPAWPSIETAAREALDAMDAAANAQKP